MRTLGVELHGAQDDLLELALAHDELGVEALAQLDDAVGDLDAGGAGELAQLAHALLGLVNGAGALRLVADVDEDGAAVLGLDLAGAERGARTRPRGPR